MRRCRICNQDRIEESIMISKQIDEFDVEIVTKTPYFRCHNCGTRYDMKTLAILDQIPVTESLPAGDES